MDRIIEALQKLLVAESITGVKKVIYGDPYKLPESDMPCITISPVDTDYISRGNQYDEKKHTISIKLVYNAKQIFGKTFDNASYPKVHAIEEAMQIAETTNVNLETQSSCIVGVLRKNLQLVDADSGLKTCETLMVTNITYQDSNSRAFPTYEVHVNFQATQVANR